MEGEYDVFANESNYTDYQSGDPLVLPMDVPHIKVILILCYVLVFICCIVGNLLVIVVVLVHEKMRTVTNFFLANLAVADFLVGVICVLPTLDGLINPDWKLGRALCKLRFFVQASSYNASIAILTAITVERYFAIIHPMRSKRMTSLCLLKGVVVCIWIFAAATGSPLIFLYDVQNGFCSPRRDKEHYLRIYVTLSFVFLYVIPLLLMLVIYTRISIVLWKTSKPDGLTRNTVAGNSSARSTRAFLKPAKGKLVSFSKTVVRLDDTRYEPVGSKDARHSNTSSDESRRKDDLMGKNGNAVQTTSDEDPISAVADDPSEDIPEAVDYENDWPIKRGSPPDDVKLYCKTVVPANTDPENTDPMNVGRTTAKRITVVNKKVPGRRQNALTARRKVVRLLIAVILCFTFCLLPHHIDSLMFYWGAARAAVFGRFLWTALIPLITYSNNGLNPFLYAFLSENFRKSLYETVCCQQRRSRHQRSMRSTTSVKTNNTTL